MKIILSVIAGILFCVSINAQTGFVVENPCGYPLDEAIFWSYTEGKVIKIIDGDRIIIKNLK